MGFLQLILGEPPLGANAKPPCSGSADQGGGPTGPWHQPPPTAGGWAFLGLLLSDHRGLPCLDLIRSGSWATLVHLSLNLCSDIFCDFLPGQSVLATCILVQKQVLHISKSKVWFMDLFE